MHDEDEMPPNSQHTAKKGSERFINDYVYQECLHGYTEINLHKASSWTAYQDWISTAAGVATSQGYDGAS